MSIHPYDFQWALGVLEDFEHAYFKESSYVQRAINLNRLQVADMIAADQFQWRLFKRLVKLRRNRHLSAAIIRDLWMITYETTTQTLSWEEENS